MGRKTKLTKQVQEDFCAAVGIGCTFEAASANAGIAYSTYRHWANLGAKAQARLDAGEEVDATARRFLSFLEAIEEAKGLALLQWQSQIDKAAKIDPMWAWRMLQVRAPQDYAPPAVRAEVSGKDGGPVLIQMTWGDTDAGDGGNDAA